MVTSTLRLRSLSLGELTGIVNIYPWFGAARKELCRRRAAQGGLSEREAADMALYIGAREKVYRLLREKGECSDKDAGALVRSLIAPAPAGKKQPAAAATEVKTAPKAAPGPAPETAAPKEERPRSRVAGADYFSAADYAAVRESGDPLLAPVRFKARKEASEDKGSQDLADRYQTESLAEILAEQGYPELAKRIYSKLILVYPEKSAYFASLIEKLD